MQSMIDRVRHEKALQAMAEDVSHTSRSSAMGRLQSNSQAVDMAAFNARESIKGTLTLMEESYQRT